MTGDRVEVLRQALDEAERKALAATQGDWHWVDPGGNVKSALVTGAWSPYDGWTMVLPSGMGDVYPTAADADHIAYWDPSRVLRLVERDRKLLDWCVEIIGDRDLSRYGEFGALKDDRDALAVTLAVESLADLAVFWLGEEPG